MTDEEILQLLYEETLTGNAPAVAGGVNDGLEHADEQIGAAVDGGRATGKGRFGGNLKLLFHGR